MERKKQHGMKEKLHGFLYSKKWQILKCFLVFFIKDKPLISEECKQGLLSSTRIFVRIFNRSISELY